MPLAMFASSAFCKEHTLKPAQKASETLHIALALGMFLACTAAAWALFIVLTTCLCSVSEPKMCTAVS